MLTTTYICEHVTCVLCVFAVRGLSVLSVHRHMKTGAHLMIKNVLGINCYTETTDETQFQMGIAIGRGSRINE